MVIISDTTPLISLLKIGRLDLLELKQNRRHIGENLLNALLNEAK